MSDDRKNVLLISVDQWSANLMGCAGHQVVMTPTLDQLAADGIRFTNCYSTCPVCIPARRSIMTGMTPASHGDRVYSDKMEMPNVATLAKTFGDNGYQTVAVGKLHVYPQRNRIGFDEVILQEEGRYEFGNVDDYQIWLGEQGCVGTEFMHCMGNNSYYTRPWHLPEHMHPTIWATREMAKQIKRKDPTRPAFFYTSYQFPHPPLVPLQAYLDMYSDSEIDLPMGNDADWINHDVIIQLLSEQSIPYTSKDILKARKAYYAQCTLIDHQIRILIGTLRECSLLDNTVIVFIADHGDMLFDHGIVGKRTFYEGSAKVPLIISGKAVSKWRGTVSDKMACLEDIMPTLLDFCGIEIPDTVEGIPLLTEKRRDLLYGEIGEGIKATRMVTDGSVKLIYYPCGNVFQLFDLKNDPNENHNLYGDKDYKEITAVFVQYMMEHLHGDDLKWIAAGKLTGMEAPIYKTSPDYELYNQRGWHWPAPQGYMNAGKT